MAYIFKDNSKDAGSFTHIPSTRMNHNTDDEMLGAGAALIIGGLLGAAAVAAAADDDYNARREAERREAARREAERKAAEIRREAERAARRAAYGMTTDEVVREIVNFCMKENLSDKMVVMTAIVRELDAQAATINSVENNFGDLRMKGRCVDGTELKITLNSIGRIIVDAYKGRLIRYSTSNKVFREYEILVKDFNNEKFDKLARVMSY